MTTTSTLLGVICFSWMTKERRRPNLDHSIILVMNEATNMQYKKLKGENERDKWKDKTTTTTAMTMIVKVWSQAEKMMVMMMTLTTSSKGTSISTWIEMKQQQYSSVASFYDTVRGFTDSFLILYSLQSLHSRMTMSYRFCVFEVYITNVLHDEQ
jgi:hypothetical protein